MSREKWSRLGFGGSDDVPLRYWQRIRSTICQIATATTIVFSHLTQILLFIFRTPLLKSGGEEEGAEEESTGISRLFSAYSPDPLCVRGLERF